MYLLDYQGSAGAIKIDKNTTDKLNSFVIAAFTMKNNTSLYSKFIGQGLNFYIIVVVIVIMPGRKVAVIISST